MLPTALLGFNGLRNEPLKLGSMMIQYVQEMGYPFEFISENTLIHHSIRNENQRLQNEYIGAEINGYEYRELNALHNGSPSQRRRRYCTSIKGAENLPIRTPQTQLTAYTHVAQCKAGTPTFRA
jgi:hypothetical protein